MEDDLYAADVPQLSPLSRLPHELLLNVARRLSLADFCALRLVSQQLSGVLRGLLAGEHFAGRPWRDNAARLDGLSRMPECAQKIRVVRVCSRAVYEDEEEMAWGTAEEGDEEEGGEGCPVAPRDPEPKMRPLADDEAARLAAQPEEKRITPLRAELLCEALCRLPRLEELALTWERWPFLSRLEMGLHRELGLFDNGSADDGGGGGEVARLLEYTTSMWQVEMLVDLATDMRPLRALTIRPFALEAMDQASYLPLVSNLFHSLVRLDLLLTQRAQVADPSVLSKLEDLLGAAWVLRELRLDLADEGPGSNDWGVVPSLLPPDFFPRTHLAGLQTLALRHAALRLDGLDAFLRRHGRTLRVLELHDVCGSGFGSGSGSGTTPSAVTVEDVFRTVRDHLPKLTRVELRGTFADDARVTHFREGGSEEGNDGWGPRWQDPVPMEKYLLRQGKLPELLWSETRRW
ncbi:hypothetical protein V2A60_007527 [Cordyceps javanica]|uniref:F-boxdomain-containing protein n=1 Tax=Cordyceps javanica TaxID=43265 RepID=A0A545VAM0_9HYPO|nr:f-boxdomain-containing protein [Cordyceps javanica]TQW09984.1 f-box domain-containing protein [Cordyceps javanica]